MDILKAFSLVEGTNFDINIQGTIQKPLFQIAQVLKEFYMTRASRVFVAIDLKFNEPYIYKETRVNISL